MVIVAPLLCKMFVVNVDVLVGLKSCPLSQESPRQTKPKEKGQNEKFLNFAHFCEFWCFSLGKHARCTLNICSGMPLRKVHELTFLWFGLPGPLLIVLDVDDVVSSCHLMMFII